MLVMRRRAGESLQIGPDIRIEILDVSPTRVRLGIVAPESVAIVREEVALTREANVDASRTVTPASIAWLSRRLSSGLPK